MPSLLTPVLDALAWPVQALVSWLTDAGLGIGGAIVVATLCMRALLAPIAYRQARATSWMVALTPRIGAIVHSSVPRAQKHAALVALYRAAGVQPATPALTALIQAPFFAGLFWVLREATEGMPSHAPLLGDVTEPATSSSAGWACILTAAGAACVGLLLSFARGALRRNWLTVGMAITVIPVTVAAGATLSVGLMCSLAVSALVTAAQAAVWWACWPPERMAERAAALVVPLPAEGIASDGPAAA